MPELAVVIPTYNERPALEIVIPNWIDSLRQLGCEFRLQVVDDGSTDGSDQVLGNLAAQYPELRIMRQANAGHGQACLAGYRLTLDDGARWIFQIDSDGQCDPAFFHDFWAARAQHPVIYGYRKRREDGVSRLMISRVLSLVILLSTGVFVRDANVPYRLMRADTVADVLNAVPTDADLANIFVAVRQQHAYGIAWRDIVFSERAAGKSHLGAARGIGKAVRLARSLRASRKSLLA